jgi:hypothetical protein
MTRRRFGQTLVAVLTCGAIPTPARTAVAQNDTARIEGKVAWISANKMVVAPRGQLPVPVDLSEVDLSEVDLDQYRALLTGDRVVVTSRLSPEGDRVIATSLQRLEA